MDGTVFILDYSSYERQKMIHVIEKIGNFNIIEVGSIAQIKLLDLETKHLKLVLLDLEFPLESDGFDLLKRLRSSENRGVPVIIITHLDKVELKTEALKYSVNDFIIKPYEVKRLESSIKSLVRVERDFHYDTDQINEIKMTFDDYITREIKFSKRTKSPLSLILITTLQIRTEAADGADEKQSVDVDKSSIFAIAVKKAKIALRSTDTIVLNNDRDIIVVLPFTDEIGAQLVCNKIITHMKLEFEKIKADQNEYIYPVYVTYPIDGDNFQMLIEKAFKKVSDKEMLDKIVSIPAGTRKYAYNSYGRYRKWF